jgi:hypothetical protein
MLQSIGDHQSITTYKAGVSKLLAARSAAAAAKNNDNYVYFATARFMQKKWGSYPEYPKMWNIYRSLEENRAGGEPGSGRYWAWSTNTRNNFGKVGRLECG